jgi:two-component system phosphate regulon sensor histidine kinase PhoR
MGEASALPSPQEIEAELAALRRRIAELEHARQAARPPAVPPAPAPTPPAAPALGPTLYAFVKRVGTILQAEKCVIMLYDPGTSRLIAQAPAFRVSDDEVAALIVSADSGLAADVFRSERTTIVPDCAADPRAVADGLPALGVRNTLTVPLVVERRNEAQLVIERTPIGVIHVFNKRYGLKFGDEDVRLLTVLARNATAVLSGALPAAPAPPAPTRPAEEKQLAYTLQSMASGLLVITQAGQVQIINAAAAELLDVDAHTATGRPFTDVIADDGLREFLQDALTRDEGQAREFTLKEHIYATEAAPVRDEQRRGMGVLCVFHDITEVRNVDRIKSDFVSTVSHELRTPLTSIKGFVRTLLDDPEEAYFDTAMRMEFYGIIDTECDRLVRLINDLLSVSRIERGLPLTMNYTDTDACALVEKCVAFQRSYSERHSLSVRLPEDALPAIVADKDKLDQVLTNLISNAIKYSPDGGLITVSVVDEGMQLRFAIADQGLGIAPEHMAKLFQRFYRIHGGDTQRVGGTGLGLFLTKTLVEAHGGAIWVESTPGVGSTFFFTIPKQPPQE